MIRLQKYGFLIRFKR